MMSFYLIMLLFHHSRPCFHFSSNNVKVVVDPGNFSEIDEGLEGLNESLLSEAPEQNYEITNPDDYEGYTGYTGEPNHNGENNIFYI